MLGCCYCDAYDDHWATELLCVKYVESCLDIVAIVCWSFVDVWFKCGDDAAVMMMLRYYLTAPIMLAYYVD